MELIGQPDVVGGKKKKGRSDFLIKDTNWISGLLSSMGFMRYRDNADYIGDGQENVSVVIIICFVSGKRPRQPKTFYHPPFKLGHKNRTKRRS